MLTICDKGKKVFVLTLNTKGMELILKNKKQFLENLDSNTNGTRNQFNKTNILGINFNCIRSDNDEIIVQCDDDNWKMTMDEYLSNYEDARV